MGGRVLCPAAVSSPKVSPLPSSLVVGRSSSLWLQGRGRLLSSQSLPAMPSHGPSTAWGFASSRQKEPQTLDRHVTRSWGERRCHLQGPKKRTVSRNTLSQEESPTTVHRCPRGGPEGAATLPSLRGRGGGGETPSVWLLQTGIAVSFPAVGTGGSRLGRGVSPPGPEGPRCL